MLPAKSVSNNEFIDLVLNRVSFQPSSYQKNILKRFFDIVSSLMVLLLFGWLLIFIAILIKFSSKGAIIYSHERIGLNGIPFRIYKFRTMYNDAEKQGPTLSQKNDPRVTPLGHVLRKLHLDELPQFYNVLIGNMSIIGTRPERKHYIQQIVLQAPEYAQVLHKKPGITSWGQLNYGYATSVEEMVERLDYDLFYLANRNMVMDLKILVYTIFLIFSGREKLFIK